MSTRGQEDKAHGERTLVEGYRELEGANELRVETRSNLNAHAAAEEPDIHESEVSFFPPSDLVLLEHAGDDGLGSRALCEFLNAHHDDDGSESNEVRDGYQKGSTVGVDMLYTGCRCKDDPLPRLVTPDGPGQGYAKTETVTVLPKRHLVLEKRVGGMGLHSLAPVKLGAAGQWPAAARPNAGERRPNCRLFRTQPLPQPCV